MRGTVLDAECSQSVICHRSITYLEVDHYLTKAFSTTPKWHERVKAPKKPDVSPCLGEGHNCKKSLVVLASYPFTLYKMLMPGIM